MERPSERSELQVESTMRQQIWMPNGGSSKLLQLAYYNFDASSYKIIRSHLTCRGSRVIGVGSYKRNNKQIRGNFRIGLNG